MMIKLADNIIIKQDIDILTKWLSETDHYTKGQKTIDFENQWSDWQGCQYSIFVNSGSSANLLVVAALLYSNRLKNNKIIIPAVSWVTTVSPAIMLGLDPVLCDADETNLGLSIEDFEALCVEHNPAAVMMVHVLGHSNHMVEIIKICDKYDVILIEDTCEAYGSTYKGTKLGNFGIASTFSYFYGHQMATVEGGMVCTNDYELYNVMLSIRSHGWLRDYITSRNSSYNSYCSHLDGKVWTQKSDNDIVSSLAFGIIDKNKKIITDELTKNGIECRPLICGSIQEHPFWHERYPARHLPVAKRVHEFGFYIPCHQNLKPEQIEFISKIILENSIGI